MSDEQLTAGIETEVITSKATREDVEAFRHADAAKGEANPSAKPPLGAPAKGTSEDARAGPKAPERDNYFDDLDDGEDETGWSGSSEQDTSDVHDDPDEFLEDDEDISDDDQEESEESIEADDAYDALVDEWKKTGLLRRAKWQAISKQLRQKFYKNILLREPVKPAA